MNKNVEKNFQLNSLHYLAVQLKEVTSCTHTKSSFQDKVRPTIDDVLVLLRFSPRLWNDPSAIQRHNDYCVV